MHRSPAKEAPSGHAPDPIDVALKEVKHAKSVVDRRLRGEQDPKLKKCGVPKEQQLKMAREVLKQKQTELALLQRNSVGTASAITQSVATTTMACDNIEARSAEVTAAMNNLVSALQKQASGDAADVAAMRASAQALQLAAIEPVAGSSSQYTDWPVQISLAADIQQENPEIKRFLSMLLAHGFCQSEIVCVGDTLGHGRSPVTLEGYYVRKRKTNVYQKIKMVPYGKIIGLDGYLYRETSSEQWRVGREINGDFLAFATETGPQPADAKSWRILRSHLAKVVAGV